eukprot:6063167-Pleurochrysis_carterae.AAC.1
MFAPECLRQAQHGPCAQPGAACTHALLPIFESVHSSMSLSNRGSPHAPAVSSTTSRFDMISL